MLKLKTANATGAGTGESIIMKLSLNYEYSMWINLNNGELKANK